jgi:hypothetical protein
MLSGSSSRGLTVSNTVAKCHGLEPPRPDASSAIKAHPIKGYSRRIQLCQHRFGPANATWEALFPTTLGPAGHRSPPLNGGKPSSPPSPSLPNARKPLAPGSSCQSQALRGQHSCRIALTLARLDTERWTILASPSAKKAQKIVTKINHCRAIIAPTLGGRGIANLTEEDLERFCRGHRVKVELNAAWLEILRDAFALGHLSKLANEAAGHFQRRLRPWRGWIGVQPRGNAGNTRLHDRCMGQ